MTQLDAVTGAFSYSGAAIARALGEAGHRVRTLTGHQERATGDIEVRPLDFTDPAGLEASLAGVHTLYNTYWVRFSRGTNTHAQTVANSQVLFDAARRAGVQRVVHVSITHPDANSPYPYFKGKAEVEEQLKGTGIPYAILRPAVLFGGDGVLINNIAWLLRHLPVFAIGGSGGYRLRPIHIDDLASLSVQQGAASGNVTVDAVGPESLTFREMVIAIRAAVGSRALIVPVPGWLLPSMSAVLGVVLRDVLLTPEEYQAMVAGLADSDAPAAGKTRLTDWLTQHRGDLGRRYANELDRHFRVREGG
jgi:NADH dehydrogenase